MITQSATTSQKKKAIESSKHLSTLKKWRRDNILVSSRKLSGSKCVYIETNCDKGYVLRRRLAQDCSQEANTNDLGKAYDNGNKAITHTH